jgi:drug/metabolite transporter (DMT)-like permease
VTSSGAVTTSSGDGASSGGGSSVDRHVGVRNRGGGEARGFVAVLFGASVLGLSAIFVKWAVGGGASPVTVGFYRMLFALPGALVLAARAGGIRRGGAARWWAFGAGGAFFLDLWLWHQAMHDTTAANATLLVSGLAPVWVALTSVLVLGARLDALAWLGQALGLGGALVLALAKGARGGTGRGELLAIVASFCYAGFTLALKRSRHALRAEQSLFWFGAGCLVCFLVAALATRAPLGGYDARAWLSLVGLGLIVQIVGWWAASWGLGHTRVALGAIALQGQQVATLFLAAWLLAEPLKPLGLLGAALIIGGIVLVARNRATDARSRAPGDRSTRPASAA